MQVTTLVMEGSRATHVERARLQLAVTSGPDRGAICRFDADAVRIGTGPGSDLTLSDPSVSRQHARIEIRHDTLWIVDLESTNGTFVNGVRIGQAVLEPSAIIRVGETSVVLSLTGEVVRYELPQRDRFGQLLGGSPVMRQLFGTLERLAATDSTVLIEGESGTGKELVAEAIHSEGHRRNGPFVVVDCGSMPAALIESELFGHQKGSFTGAIEDRAGAFEMADGGTLFLDEIGELELTLQPRLLRALDRHQVKRVGGTEYRDVDVRIIAATNRDLERQLATREFREDLYHRLAIARIRVPPLRERGDDIEMLARHFVVQFRNRNPRLPDLALSPAVIAELRQRRWPGNVRQLRNAIERAVLLVPPEGGLGTIEPDDPEATPDPRERLRVDVSQPYGIARAAWINHFERAYISAALAAARGNVAEAARAVQLDRAHLFRLMKRHDIKR